MHLFPHFNIYAFGVHLTFVVCQKVYQLLLLLPIHLQQDLHSGILSAQKKFLEITGNHSLKKRYIIKTSCRSRNPPAQRSYSVRTPVQPHWLLKYQFHTGRQIATLIPHPLTPQHLATEREMPGSWGGGVWGVEWRNKEGLWDVPPILCLASLLIDGCGAVSVIKMSGCYLCIILRNSNYSYIV